MDPPVLTPRLPELATFCSLCLSFPPFFVGAFLSFFFFPNWGGGGLKFTSYKINPPLFLKAHLQCSQPSPLLSSRTFDHPKGGSGSMSSHFPPPSPRPRQLPVCFLSLWVCLFWTFHMSRIIHYVVFGDQLLEHTGQLPAQGIKVWCFYLVVCLSAWPRHHPYHLCGSIPRLLQVPGLGLRETFPGHTIFNCNSHFTKLLFSLSALLCYTAYCYTVDLTYLSYES